MFYCQHEAAEAQVRQVKGAEKQPPYCFGFNTSAETFKRTNTEGTDNIAQKNDNKTLKYIHETFCIYRERNTYSPEDLSVL